MAMTSPTEKTASSAEYVLGHTDRELERLSRQARLVGPITREFFIDAGIVPGMRILDVGSGSGDVAFLAAELAGDKGSVVGVDVAPAAILAARRRAEAQSLSNVSFREGDPAGMTFEGLFDAIVGRYVLLFQADATQMLRQLVRLASSPAASSSSMSQTGVWCDHTQRRRHMTAAASGSLQPVTSVARIGTWRTNSMACFVPPACRHPRCA